MARPSPITRQPTTMEFTYTALAVGLLAIFVVSQVFRLSRGRMGERNTSFIMVVVVTAVVLMISTYTGLLKTPLQKLGFYSEGVVHMSDDVYIDGHKGHYIYGLMFDAGSTGSRIHAFKFFKGEDGTMKYLDELFEQVKPGLSAYADEPVKAADSLRPLLKMAQDYIPESQWSTSPMALKATAGLRLLSESKAENLLQAVRNLLKEYSFPTNEDAVVIMDGVDEGVFSWFTLNLLIGSFDGGDVKETVGVMDLGGGSTQITMVPREEETVKSAPSDFVLKKDVMGKTVDLYTHSYLGLGLMSGRLAILKAQKSDTTDEKTFSSTCFKVGPDVKWEQGGTDYIIKGVDSATPRYDSCYSTAKGVVDAAGIHKPPEIGKREFSLISYYYDRASESGLIDFEKGGQLKVEDYVNAAKKECASPRADHPFLCLDLCYISSLLQDGFGFPPKGQLMLKKQIEGTEVSWALGAMFDLFKTQTNSS